MHRLALCVSLLACLGISCASQSSSGRGAPPYPVYRVPPKQPLARPDYRATLPPRRSPGPSGSWMPSGGRISPRWTYIVIHHSATERGGAARFDRNHREINGWDELGYHFVIGNGTDTPDGFVEVGSRWHKQKHGAHCKTPDNYFNEHGIGICLVGDFTRSRPTPRQLASLEQLVRFLSSGTRIPPARITTHGDITGKTACPGHYFHLASLRRAVTHPPLAASYP